MVTVYIYTAAVVHIVKRYHAHHTYRYPWYQYGSQVHTTTIHMTINIKKTTKKTRALFCVALRVWHGMAWHCYAFLPHLPLAGRELTPPADDVHHVGQLVRRAILRPAAFVAIVWLPRAPLVLAAAVLNVDHAVFLMGRAVPRTLPILAVGWLPRAFVELAPDAFYGIYQEAFISLLIYFFWGGRGYFG